MTFRSLQIDEGEELREAKSSPTRNVLVSLAFRPEAQAPVSTLEAALRLTPSVDLRERGGKGAQADISIRGGSFDQTMVLLNGIDFTDAVPDTNPIHCPSISKRFRPSSCFDGCRCRCLCRCGEYPDCAAHARLSAVRRFGW